VGSGKPLSEPLSPAADSPKVLDNLTLWFGIAMVLVVLAYILPLASIITDSGLVDSGVRPFPMIVDAAGVSTGALTDGVSRVVAAVAGVVP